MAKKIFDKHPQERFSDFLKTIFRSFNPDSYNKLSQRSIAAGIGYLANLVLLSVMILALIVSFNMAAFQHSIKDELTKLDSLDISFNLKEPIQFSKQKITLTNEGNYTNENLLITESELIRKPTACLLFKPTCLFVKEPVRTNYSNLPEHKENVSSFVFFVLLLMIPGLLLVYLLYFLIKTLIIILVLSYTVKIITHFVKFRIKLRKIMLIAMYSSTVFIILEPINLVVWNLYYMHVLLYIIFFAIGIVLVGENKHRYHNV